MTLIEAYTLLRSRFGTHGAAAKYLGLTEQHYNALRNGRVSIPPRTAEYIRLKAQEVATGHRHRSTAAPATQRTHAEVGGDAA